MARKDVEEAVGLANAVTEGFQVDVIRSVADKGQVVVQVEEDGTQRRLTDPLNSKLAEQFLRGLAKGLEVGFEEEE